ncbi:receptor-like protein EIX2 [Eucalyptus grandis]|uniref:receptor-like protein EIX2 n=1 Tax=Eucalyptus grandis TaxID=71139 RepID=UPI00192ED4F4|nr:receptor-like protein EIX2 [Eucalyptus grandis]
MASYFYTSFVPTLLCALFVIQTLEFSHSKALTNVSCIDAEREALLKFKQDLIDPSRRLGSWTGESCCEWEGVECNEKTGHVSKLDLRNPFDDGRESCSLGGKIHPALNKLKYLKYLDLSYNNFTTHKTQKSLTSLHKMEYLNLSYAGYGHISNQLSNLSSLRPIDEPVKKEPEEDDDLVKDEELEGCELSEKESEDDQNDPEHDLDED